MVLRGRQNILECPGSGVNVDTITPVSLSLWLAGREHNNNKQPERADCGLSTVLTGLVTCDIQYPRDILT